MGVRIYLERDFAAHATPAGHPERPARLEAVARALAGYETLDPPWGDEADVLRCHPEAYISRLKAGVPTEGVVALDGDTFLSPGSIPSAMRAVGAVCAGVDAVLDDEAKTVFCGVRPPGHHAETSTSMGFCLFGSAAIGAKRALEVHGLSRVAVVDFDVHHGNGTQDLLWDEARALFVSSHQMPLYPGTGAAHERGAHNNVYNVPLPPMSGGVKMRQVYEELIVPELDRFAPELIIISAGFDAHIDDPLANLQWTEEDFAWVTGVICDVAERHAGGRVVSTLEGGYDLDALAASVAAHVAVLEERG